MHRFWIKPKNIPFKNNSKTPPGFQHSIAFSFQSWDSLDWSLVNRYIIPVSSLYISYQFFLCFFLPPEKWYSTRNKKHVKKKQHLKYIDSKHLWKSAEYFWIKIHSGQISIIPKPECFGDFGGPVPYNQPPFGGFPSAEVAINCLPGDSKWPVYPVVGGHLTFPKGHLTIPIRSPAELPGIWAIYYKSIA